MSLAPSRATSERPAGKSAASLRLARVMQAAARHATLIILVVEFVVFSAFAPDFLSVRNLMLMAKAVAVLGITAAGATIGLVSGALDLSVGAVIGVSGVAAVTLLGTRSGAATPFGLPGAVGYVGDVARSNVPIVVGVMAGLGVGLLVGLINGLVVTRLRVNPIIATLASMVTLRGLAYRMFGVLGSTIQDPAYLVFSRSVGFVPVPVIALAILYVVVHLVLTHTTFGRHIYAVGGNPSAARAAAIPVDRLRVVCLTLSGLLAAVAGLVLSSMGGAGIPSAGTGYELSAITAVVLGGCALAGGRGTIGGTFIGVLIIGMLINGMNMAGIPAYYQQVLQGLALLLAVFIDATRTGGYR
jgi:ribose transport system permease protein